MPVLKEEERIYIDALAEIIDRKIGTIRRWQADERLPKHLLPKRGSRRRRYWTHAQVYGPRGIIAWMKKNDMRPGPQLTDPAKEKEHLAHLRKPKYLNGNNIRSAREMADNGRSRKVIINRLYPRTRYSSKENLERALVGYFEKMGWYFPPVPPKSKAQLRREQALEREIARLEKKMAKHGIKV